MSSLCLGYSMKGGYSTNCFFKIVKIQVSAYRWVGKRIRRKKLILPHTYLHAKYNNGFKAWVDKLGNDSDNH